MERKRQKSAFEESKAKALSDPNSKIHKQRKNKLEKLLKFTPEQLIKFKSKEDLQAQIRDVYLYHSPSTKKTEVDSIINNLWNKVLKAKEADEARISKVAEIYLDNSYWKRVSKHVGPSTKHWIDRVRKDADLASKLIPKTCIISVNNSKIRKDAIIKELFEVSYSLWSSRYAGTRKKDLKERWDQHGDAIIYEQVEIGVIKVAIEDMTLSGKIFYNGKRLLEECSSPSLDSARLGYVYIFKNGDLHKIGITENLLQRIQQLKPEKVVNAILCKNFNSLESRLHKYYKGKRLPQSEYFRLNESEICEAIEIMHNESILK